MRALIAGTLVVDIITVIADSDIEQVTMSNASSSFLMLEQGHKLDAKQISDHVGGGAANVGTSLARLGWTSDILGCVGNDLSAEKIRATLTKDGVGLDNIKVAPEMCTGISVLISSHDQNAAIFTHRGANGGLLSTDITGLNFSAFDLLYVAPLSNDSADIFPALVKSAKEKSVFVAVNPGVRQLTSRADAFLDAAKNIDLLALNFSEVECLLPFLDIQDIDEPISQPPFIHQGFHLSSRTVSFWSAIDALYRLVPSYILITNGTNGSYLFEGKTLIHCPVAHVTPMGTAGAGDAFVSTFASALVAGQPTHEALQKAALNSAAVVGKVNTTSGLLTAKDLAIKHQEKSHELVCTSWKRQ